MIFASAVSLSSYSSLSYADSLTHCPVGTPDTNNVGQVWLNGADCIIVDGPKDGCVNYWSFLTGSSCDPSTYISPTTNPTTNTPGASAEGFPICFDDVPYCDMEYDNPGADYGDGWGWTGTASCVTKDNSRAQESCSYLFPVTNETPTNSNPNGWIVVKLELEANDSYILHGVGNTKRKWLNDDCTSTVKGDLENGEVEYVFPVRNWITDVSQLQGGAMSASCEEIRAAMVPVTNPAPTPTAGCDYTNAGMYGGWGWNPATEKSCEPLDDTTVVDNTVTQPGDAPNRFANDPWGILDSSWGDPNAAEYTQDELSDNFFADMTNEQIDPNSQYPVTRMPLYFDDFTQHMSNGEVVQSRDTSNSNNNEASFRIFCGVSHFQKVDPIVSYGEPSGHLHMFWGNTRTDENSHVKGFDANGVPLPSASDISRHGQSTCQGGPYNRSAYWMPAMLTKESGTLEVVVPEKLHIYYKGRDVKDETINELPLGIQLLGGNIDMPRSPMPRARWRTTPAEGIPSTYTGKMIPQTDHVYTAGRLTRNESPSIIGNIIPFAETGDPDFVHWGCYAGEGIVEKKSYNILSSNDCRTITSTARPGIPPGCSKYFHKDENGDEANCKRYTAMEATIRFPQCLALKKDANGNDILGEPALFSANNVDHAYAVLSSPDSLIKRCPENTHPYRIPQITYRVRFNIPGSDQWEDEAIANPDIHTIGNYNAKPDTMETWRLSSDHHMRTEAQMLANRGWSLHGDWLGAWNPKLVTHWTNQCFDQDQPTISNRVAKNCDAGQMDSTFGLKHFEGTYVITNKSEKMKYKGYAHPKNYNRPMP